MKIISVLFLFTLLLFSSDVRAKSLVEGMKNEREIQQDEIQSQEPLYENARIPSGYGENGGYAKVGQMYDASNFRRDIMKRSLRSHHPTQRQTGIIYGGGKPIGILQPYQESFKFMPIHEERAFSVDSGRSAIDQQEPYLNLMYPLARFTRSEDAVRMAEAEAAKAQFLDEHYPSMLVDFKIHNKLHPSNYEAKSAQNFNLKREENGRTNNDIKKKKRDSQTPSAPSQKLHKRDSQHVLKGESTTINKQPEQTVTIQKREEEKKVEKREEKKTSTPQKRHSSNSAPQETQQKTKKKRQNKLTDSQFEILKNTIKKRNSNGHIQFMEEDLKGLLSDMGLIEDDLQENAEEMEERKRQVSQDEDLEEGFDTTAQKDKEKQKREEKKEEKRDDKKQEKREGKKLEKRDDKKEEKREEKKEEKRQTSGSSERKRREEDDNAPTSIPLIETRNADSKKRTLNDILDKRSSPETSENGKRFIEVSFSTKDNKEASEGDSGCPKPSVIPNKREVSQEQSSENKEENSAARDKKSEVRRSNEASSPTTESYEEYEQRVAREIKNKIRLLKEEVKRELGALESDKEDEDDDDTLAETQRKKRFITNTLIDEESQNIDPNENLENSELEPHVRRRRFLSTDMMSFVPQKTSFEKSNFEVNYDPMSVVQSKFDFDTNSLYGEPEGRSFYAKSDITKKDVMHGKARRRKANDYNPYMSDSSGTRRFHWEDPSIYMRTQGRMFFPEYQRKMTKFVSAGSRRNSRDDLSENSDYDSEASNDEELAESNSNPPAELTKKPAERKTETRLHVASEEHAPKKLQGNQNQKFFYYFMGNNENEKKDAAAQKNQRASTAYTYRMPNGYQNQYYNAMSRGQAKQFVNDQSQVRRLFQRRYEPFIRRRKRHTNLMVPLVDSEHALVSNLQHHNSSYYPRSRKGKYHEFPSTIQKMKGAVNSTSDWSKEQEAGRQPLTEKEYLYNAY